MHKKGPYILLGTLTIVLIFIVGVRYGQNVEKTNKAIVMLQSITPPVSPTQTPIGFKTYELKNCGISFLYPDSLVIDKETTTSAVLSQNKKTAIQIDCEKQNMLGKLFTDPKTASDEITFQNKKLLAKKIDGSHILQFKNFRLNSIVTFFSLDSLLPLLDKSLTIK